MHTNKISPNLYRGNVQFWNNNSRKDIQQSTLSFVSYFKFHEYTIRVRRNRWEQFPRESFAFLVCICVCARARGVLCVCVCVAAISASAVRCRICFTRCHMRRRQGREAGRGGLRYRLSLFLTPPRQNGRVLASPPAESLLLRPLRRFSHQVDQGRLRDREIPHERMRRRWDKRRENGRWNRSRVASRVPYFAVSSAHAVLRVAVIHAFHFLPLARSVPRVLVTHASPRRSPGISCGAGDRRWFSCYEEQQRAVAQGCP